MVPMFLITSSRVMPMPLSITDSVRWSRSASMRMCASPGASTAVPAMLDVMERCFNDRYTASWQPKLKEMIPSYGHDLKTDAALTERVRKDTAAVLGLQTV